MFRVLSSTVYFSDNNVCVPNVSYFVGSPPWLGQLPLLSAFLYWKSDQHPTELSNSGYQLIIVRAIKNRDLDSILSYYRNYLSISVLSQNMDNIINHDSIEVQKTVKD